MQDGRNAPATGVVHDERCDCELNYPKRPVGAAKHLHLPDRRVVWHQEG